MIKLFLAKWHHRLLMSSDDKSTLIKKWYQENLRWKLYILLNDILYEKPEWTIKTIINRHSKLVSYTSLVLLFISLIFFVGRSSRNDEFSEINKEKQKVENVAYHYYNLVNQNFDTITSKQAMIDSFNSYFNSREWREFVVYKESKIKIPTHLPDSIFNLMEEERKKYNIPNSIYWRLIHKESTFRYVVNEKSGANGFMQVMPGTFEYFKDSIGVCNHNEMTNIMVGSYILNHNYERFVNKGYDEIPAWELALAEYNAGLKPIIAAGWNIPNYKETKNYVRFIIKEHKKEAKERKEREEKGC